jgi:DnaJ family protein C protein 2
LLNPETRRQFDSVDPAIEDHVPNAKTVSAEEYCQVFGPIFAREARFSKKQPVPSFGDENASKQDVESFYDFWYNFDSWRSFEALDKEVNEGSDS